MLLPGVPPIKTGQLASLDKVEALPKQQVVLQPYTSFSSLVGIFSQVI